MSGLKMQMRLFTNQSSQQSQNSQNQVIQQSIARSFQNQNSFLKLGNNGQKRNYEHVNKFKCQYILYRKTNGK